MYKKVVEFSFTPTKNILVFSFSFWFQFIQRIEQWFQNQIILSMNIFPLIFQVPVWSFSSAGAKIIHMLAKPTEEVVHSQGRVMADRSVLFKYINPNLAFVLAEGQDTTGKGFVNIYLLDLVTGRIIFSANHRRVQV